LRRPWETAVAPAVAVNYSSDREAPTASPSDQPTTWGEAISVGRRRVQGQQMCAVIPGVDASFGITGRLVNNAGVFRFGNGAEDHREACHSNTTSTSLGPILTVQTISGSGPHGGEHHQPRAHIVGSHRWRESCFTASTKGAIETLDIRDSGLERAPRNIRVTPSALRSYRNRRAMCRLCTFRRLAAQRGAPFGLGEAAASGRPRSRHTDYRTRCGVFLSVRRIILIPGEVFVPTGGLVVAT